MAPSVSLGLDLSRNYSFFTVPAALITTLVPHAYSVIASGRRYDNRNPRKVKDRISKTNGIEEHKKQRILRAKAASENGFETLGFFSAAVVAANVARVAPRELNILSVGYILSRIAYNIVYVRVQDNDNPKIAHVRSGLWGAGIVLTVTLWVKAGLKVAKVKWF